MLNKLIIIPILMFFSCNVNSQVQYQGAIGVPFNFNKPIDNFILDSMGLNKRIGAHYVVGVRYLLDNKFFIGFNGSFSNYSFSDDNAKLIINHNYAYLCSGKEFLLAKKFKIGISVDLCISTSWQSLTKSNIAEDAWVSFSQDEYNYYSKKSRVQFSIGSELYFDYSISQRTILNFGLKNSITSQKKMDYINDIPVYGFFLGPYIGMRFNVIKNEE